MTSRYHPTASLDLSSIDDLPTVDELHSLADSVRLTFEARRIETDLRRMEIELLAPIRSHDGPSLH